VLNEANTARVRLLMRLRDTTLRRSLCLSGVAFLTPSVPVWYGPDDRFSWETGGQKAEAAGRGGRRGG